jgi:hypothetical protein
MTLPGLWREPRGRQLLLAVLVVLVISWFYAFLASAGTFETLLNRPGHYDRMCAGFQAGHLYIVEQPKAALLAKANPFAPENHAQNLWIWDASLYKGRYYEYWGPIPALLLLAWKALTGQTGVVTDQWPTVLYMAGRLFCGAGLLLGLAGRIRPHPPTWLVTLTIAVFGLSGPIPFIVARPRVYEASLAAGQFFLFAGLLACFVGLTRARRRSVMFAAASFLWGLAFGSRATTIVSIPFIIGATVYFVWLKQDRSWTAALKNALLLGLPVGVFVVAHGVYNYARFDSPFEFGVRFQTTLQPFSTHPRFIIPNIYSYLFAPVKWSCSFPFVTGQTDRPLSTLIDWPRGYKTFEKVAGILVMGGFGWLGLLPAGWAARRFWRRWRPAMVAPHPSLPLVHLWGIVCSLAVLVSMGPALGLWEASMRYSGDAIGGMVVIAAIVAFWLVRRSDDSGVLPLRALSRTLVLLLGLHSCFVGAFSGFSSYTDPFKHHNPTLYRQLSDALSLCE